MKYELYSKFYTVLTNMTMVASKHSRTAAHNNSGEGWLEPANAQSISVMKLFSLHWTSVTDTKEE